MKYIKDKFSKFKHAYYSSRKVAWVTLITFLLVMVGVTWAGGSILDSLDSPDTYSYTEETSDSNDPVDHEPCDSACMDAINAEPVVREYAGYLYPQETITHASCIKTGIGSGYGIYDCQLVLLSGEMTEYSSWRVHEDVDGNMVSAVQN